MKQTIPTAGITKEMWTTAIQDGDDWEYMDVLSETLEEELNFIKIAKRKGHKWAKHAKASRCIVSFYPPE